MIRTVALIDGYNFYHPLESHFKKTGENLKWLNYRKFFERLLQSDSRLRECQLSEIYFFTAIASHRGPEAVDRHLTYLQALEITGVKIIKGIFKKKHRSCKSCNTTWLGHEEKETDVRIATKLIELAMNDAFDYCLLCSADSDLVPAVEMVKKYFPKKQIVLVTPPSKVNVEKLKSLCHFQNRPFHIKTNISKFQTSQFEAELLTENGIKICSPYICKTS